MRRPGVLVAAGVALVALLLHALAAERREAAELRGALGVRDSLLRAGSMRLAAQRARIDTVHRVDSLRFVAWRTRYAVTTDTVRVHDTLYVRKDLADATLHACSDALGSCERAKAVRDSIIANERARREVVERMLAGAVRDARARQLQWGVLGAAAGALACELRR